MFFVFVSLVLFPDVILFLFFVVWSLVFVLNHNIRFVFVLHIILLLFFVLCFGICYFYFCDQSKTFLEKLEISKTPKMKTADKTDILTRAVSTGVFTNSFFFCFCGGMASF